MVSLSTAGTGRSRGLLVVSCLFIVLPIPVVFMRLWARRLKGSRLCFNDYAVIAGLICSTGCNVSTAVAIIKGGFGQHVTEVTASEFLVYSKTALASLYIWPTGVCIVKLSILHFYISIFRKTWIKYVSYVIGILTILWWIANIVGASVICTPFDYNWNKTVDGHCGNIGDMYMSFGITNIVLDVLILIEPLPVLWRLNMRWQRKLNLTAIFSLGTGICIVSIVRCIANATLDTKDITYSEVTSDITTDLELMLSVINACLPLLAPVVARFGETQSFRWLKTVSKRISTSQTVVRIQGRVKTSNKETDTSHGTVTNSARTWLPRGGDLNDDEVFTHTDFMTTTQRNGSLKSVSSKDSQSASE